MEREREEMLFGVRGRAGAFVTVRSRSSAPDHGNGRWKMENGRVELGRLGRTDRVWAMASPFVNFGLAESYSG